MVINWECSSVKFGPSWGLTNALQSCSWGKGEGGPAGSSARQLGEPSPKLLPDFSWRTSRLPVLSRKLPALSGQRNSSGQGLHAMQWKLHLILNPAWAHMIVPAVFVHPTFPLTPALHILQTSTVRGSPQEMLFDSFPGSSHSQTKGGHWKNLQW